jgi:capsular polysaccharide biosynthesis protein
MGSDSLMKALLVRWPVTVAGLLMTAVLGALAFSIVPAQYSSSATAVLVPGRQPGLLSNPLLSSNSGLNTTALIVVQAVSAPQVPEELGLVSGVESFTIENDGSVAIRTDGIQQPFISVNAQARDPQRAVMIVSEVLTVARQSLVDQQKAARVSRGAMVQLQVVVSPESPKLVWRPALRSAGIAVVLGIIATIACVSVSDRRARRRPDVADARDWSPVHRDFAVAGEIVSHASPALPVEVNGSPRKE